jgi:hypothetical protein
MRGKNGERAIRGAIKQVGPRLTSALIASSLNVWFWEDHPLELFLLVIAALVSQQPAQSVFDRPIGELREGKAAGPLDKLSLNQMMRMTSLPAARMRELQCAGLAHWNATQGANAWPALALPDPARATFVEGVVQAIANDIEADREAAQALVEGYSTEPKFREEKGDLTAYRAEMESECSGLIAGVRVGTYRLAPLARPSVVNTTLASCYARYTVAADGADGEEAKSMRETAAKAERLALTGKAGEKLDLARAALADELAAARADKASQAEGEMMRLIMCLPAMAAVDKEIAAKEAAK